MNPLDLGAVSVPAKWIFWKGAVIDIPAADARMFGGVTGQGAPGQVSTFAHSIS